MTATKHIHHDVIIEWAKGATIQYYDNEDEKWIDTTHNKPIWSEDGKYRVKPKPVTKWYRVALFKKGNDDCLLFVSGNDFLEKNYESQKNFVRWVTERQYVEVE